MGRRYNPTRRGDIPLHRCLCGWSRKRQKWVRNGCPMHSKEDMAKKNETTNQK